MDRLFTRNGASEEVNYIDGYNSVAIQSDDKIITAGYRFNYGEYKFTLMRHHTDGSVDSSFTVSTLPEIGFNKADKNFLAIQSNSKIVVAGTVNNNFAVALFNKEGQFEKLKITDFDGQNDIVTALVLQKNDDIILIGNSQNNTTTSFAIAKYKKELIPDNSFSEDGKLITGFDTDKNFALDVAVQNNGDIIAMGYIDKGGNNDAAVAKFTINGVPDYRFANNGKYIESIIQGSTKYTSMAVQNDAKIVTAGYTLQNKNIAFALARYTSNGKPDITFGSGGIQINDFGFSNNTINSIAIKDDGKIIAGGSINNSLALARYNRDGSLDNTFGKSGLQKDSLGIRNYINTICIQKDGKILAGGSVLARYNNKGSLDSSFNKKGFLTNNFSENESFNCTAIAVQKNGDIIILGN